MEVTWTDTLRAVAKIEYRWGQSWVTVTVVLPKKQVVFTASGLNITTALQELFQQAVFSEEAKIQITRCVERQRCIRALKELGDA